MFIIKIAQVVLLALAIQGSPTNPEDLQTPAQDRKWDFFKKERGPQYEINPNFGFRSYHQIRYEPMSVPFEHPAPIAPIDVYTPAGNYGDGGYGMDAGYPMDGGYPVDGYAEDAGYGYGEPSMHTFQTVPYTEKYNSPPIVVDSAPAPSEFSSRRASYRGRYV